MSCSPDLLRDEWGFDGFVVSDYFSIRQLANYHRLAESAATLRRSALNAGLDVELPTTDCFGDPAIGGDRSGSVSDETLDDAVRRVLSAKFELGLFEKPYVDPEVASAVVDTPFHRELARRSPARAWCSSRTTACSRWQTTCRRSQ